LGHRYHYALIADW